MDNYLQELLTVYDLKSRDLVYNDTLEKAAHRKGLHNHPLTELSFMSSNFYRERYDELNAEILPWFENVQMENRYEALNEYYQSLGKKYNELRESQKDLEEYGLEQIVGFSELYARHFHAQAASSDFPHRFPIERSNESYRNDVILAYNYAMYPDQHEICYFQDTLGAVWTLVHVGMAHYALPIMRKLTEDFNTFMETGKTNYPFLDHEPHWARFCQSTDWAYAWIYRQLGQIELFSEHLQGIINRHPLYANENGNEKLQIFWHTGVARILEAAVQLHKIKPTEENKKKLNDIFKYNHQMECQEHNESLREMLMAIYTYGLEIYNYGK
jgi:hypothetical protein